MNKPLLLFFSILSFHCSSNTESPEPSNRNNPVTTNASVSAPKIDSSLVVFDSLSGLCWMRQDFSFIMKRFLDNWEKSFNWQKQINSSNYAGFNDWRVPTINEYRTINKTGQDRINYRINFIELDTSCAWGKGPYAFWSSTTPNQYIASYISFIDGFATSGNKGKKFSGPSSSWKGVELGMSVRLVRTFRQ